MLTVDGGKSWTAPAGQLPEAIRQFDCRAVAVMGHACWIAGTPGTLVFHTPDGGHTWASFSTGQPLPIRALTFLDINRGWAVGALGTIMATRDGGRTWTIQQQGGARAALLGIFADEQRIPLELFADLAGDEGYLSVVDVVARRHPDPASASVTARDERTHEAIVAVGGSQAESAWQFPLRHAGLKLSASAIAADWQRWHGPDGRDALEAYAARQIRIWRPEIIITEPGSSRGDDPVGQMVSQAVLAAAEKAGEAAQFAEQIGAAGLAPWKVKKVYSSLGGEAAGGINLTTSQLAPRLGGSLVDHARRGWQLLRTRHDPPPQTYGFRLLVNRVPSDVGQRDFFSGTQAGTVSDCRRSALKPPPGDVRTLSRLAQQRRNTQQLLQHLAESSPAEAAWLSQVENLTRGLEPAAGSEVLFELAQSLLDADRADLAAPASGQRRSCVGFAARTEEGIRSRFGCRTGRGRGQACRASHDLPLAGGVSCDRRQRKGRDVPAGEGRPARRLRSTSGVLWPADSEFASRAVHGSGSPFSADRCRTLSGQWPRDGKLFPLPGQYAPG
jgi:hypothetical protein